MARGAQGTGVRSQPVEHCRQQRQGVANHGGHDRAAVARLRVDIDSPKDAVERISMPAE